MKWKLLEKVVLLGFIALLCGCANMKAQVGINSISAPDSSGKTTYALFPASGEVDKNDLQYQEYAGYIDIALKTSGYSKTEDVQQADVLVFLGYGIGDPQTVQYAYSIPILGQTGVASSSTSGNVNVNSAGNNATYSSTTTNTPMIGVTGAITQRGSYTTFDRYYILEAIDADLFIKTNEKKQVWQTIVTSTGRSGDLRRVFPVLVDASQPYIAKNTGKIVLVEVPKARLVELGAIDQ